MLICDDSLDLSRWWSYGFWMSLLKRTELKALLPFLLVFSSDEMDSSSISPGRTFRRMGTAPCGVRERSIVPMDSRASGSYDEPMRTRTISSVGAIP